MLALCRRSPKTRRVPDIIGVVPKRLTTRRRAVGFFTEDRVLLLVQGASGGTARTDISISPARSPYVPPRVAYLTTEAMTSCSRGGLFLTKIPMHEVSARAS